VIAAKLGRAKRRRGLRWLRCALLRATTLPGRSPAGVDGCQDKIELEVVVVILSLRAAIGGRG